MRGRGGGSSEQTAPSPRHMQSARSQAVWRGSSTCASLDPTAWQDRSPHSHDTPKSERGDRDRGEKELRERERERGVLTAAVRRSIKVLRRVGSRGATHSTSRTNSSAPRHPSTSPFIPSTRRKACEGEVEKEEADEEGRQGCKC